MLWKPPWGEEHHWKIISLSNTLLILVPLLVTFQPRDREKVTLQSVSYPGTWETWLWCQALPQCSLWDWTDHLFIPLCLTTPPPWPFLLHGLFNVYFYSFQNKGFLLVWVAHSLIVLSRWKPWSQTELSNQKVLISGLSLWYPPCHCTLQVNVDTFLN